MAPIEPDVIGVIDMHDEELLRDPFGGYSQIRERAPLARAVRPGVQAWLVTRYDDIKMVLNDSRFVSDPANVPGINVEGMSESVLRAQGLADESLRYILANMQNFDGAEHTRLRGIVSQAFTVRRVAGLRPQIAEIAGGLLDRLPESATGGVVDLLWHFAYPLSGTVQCELVGVPEEDRPQWATWRAAISSVDGLGKAEVWNDVIAYVRELVERRRAEPADDLVSGLVQAQDQDGDRLSDTEMVGMVVTLGLTTQQTAHLIANGTFALLTHRDQLTLLRENLELTPRAVHEVLRWCSPTYAPPHMRFATEDVNIGGVPVRKGEAVWIVLSGANWDPRRFSDPDRFDITREPNRRHDSHLAFGYGPHICLGAALARLEAEVAFAALLPRFPDLALAVDPADLEREPMPGHWRLTALPVRL